MTDSLALLLQSASEGEREAVLSFLRSFQKAQILVPEKNQSPPFTSFPAYPDRPLNILAVQDGPNVVVPAFSDHAKLLEWSNRPLQYRTTYVCDLIKVLPENWWLAFNPAQDVRKDFSPWELQRLLGSEVELQEIATELEIEYGVEPLAIRKLNEHEFTEVKALLLKELVSDSNIKEIYLALEKGKTVEGSAVETLLIGVRVKDLPPTEAEAIRQKIKTTIAPSLIGSIQQKVLLGVGFSDVELGIFADLPPTFTAG